LHPSDTQAKSEDGEHAGEKSLYVDLSSLLFQGEDLTDSTINPQDDTLIQFVGGGVGGCVASICTIPHRFYILVYFLVFVLINKT
jgi:hypothetical protein